MEPKFKVGDIVYMRFKEEGTELLEVTGFDTDGEGYIFCYVKTPSGERGMVYEMDLTKRKPND